MCLYPKVIKNKKYTDNKKNKGNIPELKDERVKYVPVGCQKCIECRKQKARNWQVRLSEDIKENKNGKFVTLTFSDESIKKIIEENEELKNIKGYELDNEIATKAVRLFLERWRKKYKKSVRHWLVTELGHNGTENIHLHGIIWTDKIEEVEKIWKYGYIWSGNKRTKENYVNEKTVNYIVKYIHKTDEKHKEYTSIILTSAGIGSNYIKSGKSKENRYKKGETNETYRKENGRKTAIPVYWRNKIYTEEEREKLWIEKIEKNERWVCGEKIKADNWVGYNKLLEWYRRLNKELGYGNDEKNWNRVMYENQRREMLNKKRIEKVKKGKK